MGELFWTSFAHFFNRDGSSLIKTCYIIGAEGVGTKVSGL